MFPTSDVHVIDLSVGIESGIVSEPSPADVQYIDHARGAAELAETLGELGIDGVAGDDFPDGLGLAVERVHATPHTATHMDAPWHYGPTVGDDPSKTIDQIPLEWCFGDAVVLDFTWKEASTEITVDELEAQLEALGHSLTTGEIVLIETGSHELWGTPEYLTDFPGMSAEGTKYLVDEGVRVIGTDAYGFDKPFVTMGERFEETGDGSELWPAHFAGREVEYCQIEKLANLDALPRRTDIPFFAFPINIANASAGWVRAVALIEESP